MNTFPSLAPLLIQLALLLVILSAVYSAYMVVVIGAVVARQRRLRRSKPQPVEASHVSALPRELPRDNPSTAVRFVPAPTDVVP